ncbi:hypothetical protein D9M71_792410 [compost metagenome]
MNDKIRKEFEVWAKSRYMPLRVASTGEYWVETTQSAWESWQAARSTLIVLPVINPEMFNEDVLFGFEKARNAAKAKLEAMGFKVSA